jgi:hypothetical protein
MRSNEWGTSGAEIRSGDDVSGEGQGKGRGSAAKKGEAQGHGQQRGGRDDKEVAVGVFKWRECVCAV